MSVVAVRRPLYESNKIFAFDFVYFLAREYKTNWVPNSMIIDPLSPMTTDIEVGARAILRNNDYIFEQVYAALVPPGMSAHVGIFYAYAVKTFRVFFDTCGTPEVFFYLVYVARLGILFYQRGVREAPDYAALFIAEILTHYMVHVYPGLLFLFQAIGRDLARLP